jgi:hypothetical protein
VDADNGELTEELNIPWLSKFVPFCELAHLPTADGSLKRAKQVTPHHRILEGGLWRVVDDASDPVHNGDKYVTFQCGPHVAGAKGSV